MSNMRSRLRGRWSMAIATAIVVVLVLIALFPSIVTQYDPLTMSPRNRLLPPSVEHIFGTDEIGRDVFSRIAHGTRYSLGMSVVVVLAASILGTLVGSVAGLAGKRVDEILMRLVDMFLSFPSFILAMAIAAALGRGMMASVVALSIIWWPSYARLVRGMVLGIRENLFVEAARALGTSNWRIIWWHILPHCFRQINAKMTLDFGVALLALTGLGFLGLGLQNPTPEWGLMVFNATGYVMSAWWYALFPGLFIFLCVMSFATIGDALGQGNRFK